MVNSSQTDEQFEERAVESHCDTGLGRQLREAPEVAQRGELPEHLIRDAEQDAAEEGGAYRAEVVEDGLYLLAPLGVCMYRGRVIPVSYTHLTLPTILLV